MMSHHSPSPMTGLLAQGFSGAADQQTIEEKIGRTLRAIRTHLGMDVAFVSEFSAGRRYFRHVDASLPNPPLQVGGSDPLEDSYCQRVVDGRLPELIHDASALAAARDLPVTAALPVGAHLSVPLKLSDGQVYGTFCCFSFVPDFSLGERDLGMMRVFAELSAAQIEEDIARRKTQAAIESRIGAALAGDALSMVYQPIVRIAEGRIVGFESLARFSAPPPRSPDIWFGDADLVGLGVALEAKAIRLALANLDCLPADIYVSVNASPACITSGSMEDVLQGQPLERIVVEVTEHAAIDHYQDIAQKVKPLRERGLRIAVDDAGAGYASFRHILNLSPDIIKLDISLTRDIDVDRSRRALAAALISFANATGAKIVAEGVETESELSALRQLGVTKAQGYFLGKPMPIDRAAEAATWRAAPGELRA